jgi:hypothetical protein
MTDDDFRAWDASREFARWALVYEAEIESAIYAIADKPHCAPRILRDLLRAYLAHNGAVTIRTPARFPPDP